MFSTNGRSLRCFVGGGRFHISQPSDLVAVRDGELLAVCDPGGNKVALFYEVRQRILDFYSSSSFSFSSSWSSSSSSSSSSLLSAELVWSISASALAVDLLF